MPKAHIDLRSVCFALKGLDPGRRKAGYRRLDHQEKISNYALLMGAVPKP